MGILAELATLKEQQAALTAKIKAASESAKDELANIDKSRLTLSTEIHKAIKGLNVDGKLKELGCFQFTYKVDGSIENGVATNYKAVSVGTPKRVSTNGGRSGKTSSDLKFTDGSNNEPSLHEVYEAFATDDDKALMVEAEAKPEASRGNATYIVKVAVKKRSLDAGLIKAK